MMAPGFTGRSAAAFAATLTASPALAAGATAPSPDAALRTFDIPEGDAVAALRLFTQQSGELLIYPGELVAGVRTAAIKGPLAPLDALRRMFRRTEIVAARDDRTGALLLRRKSAPPSSATDASRDATSLSPDPTPMKPTAPRS